MSRLFQNEQKLQTEAKATFRNNELTSLWHQAFQFHKPNIEVKGFTSSVQNDTYLRDYVRPIWY